MPRGYAPEDLLELRLPGDPQVSPDGTRIAFTLLGIDSEHNRYFSSSLWPTYGLPAGRAAMRGD